MAGDASLGITPVMKWNFERSCYRWLVTRHPAQFERLDFTAQILQSASRARKAFYECGWAEAKVLIRPSDGKFERTPFFDAIIRRGLRNSTRFDAATLTEDEIEALGMHRDETLGFKLQIRHFRSSRKELPPQGRGGGAVRKAPLAPLPPPQAQAHRHGGRPATAGARLLLPPSIAPPPTAGAGNGRDRAALLEQQQQQQQQQQRLSWGAAEAVVAAAAAGHPSGDLRWADEARWHHAAAAAAGPGAGAVMDGSNNNNGGGGERWAAWDGGNRWMPGEEGAGANADDGHRHRHAGHATPPLLPGLAQAPSPAAAAGLTASRRSAAVWEGAPHGGGWVGGPADIRQQGSSWHPSGGASGAAEGRGQGYERMAHSGIGEGAGVARDAFAGDRRHQHQQPEVDVRGGGGGGGLRFHPSAVEHQQHHAGPSARTAAPRVIGGSAVSAPGFRHGAVSVDPAPAAVGGTSADPSSVAAGGGLLSQGYRRLAAMADEQAAAAAGGDQLDLSGGRRGGGAHPSPPPPPPPPAAVLHRPPLHHSPIGRPPLPHEYDAVAERETGHHKRSASSLVGAGSGGRDPAGYSPLGERAGPRHRQVSRELPFSSLAGGDGPATKRRRPSVDGGDRPLGGVIQQQQQQQQVRGRSTSNERLTHGNGSAASWPSGASGSGTPLPPAAALVYDDVLAREFEESERELLSSRVAVDLAQARFEEASRTHHAKREQVLAAAAEHQKQLSIAASHHHQGQEQQQQTPTLKGGASVHSPARSSEVAAETSAPTGRAAAAGGRHGAANDGRGSGSEERHNSDSTAAFHHRRDSAPLGRRSPAARGRSERPSEAYSRSPSLEALGPDSASPAGKVSSSPSPSAAGQAQPDCADEMMEVKLEAALLCGMGRAPVSSRQLASAAAGAAVTPSPKAVSAGAEKGLEIVSLAAAAAAAVSSSSGDGDGNVVVPPRSSSSSSSRGGIRRDLSERTHSPLPSLPWKGGHNHHHHQQHQQQHQHHRSAMGQAPGSPSACGETDSDHSSDRGCAAIEDLAGSKKQQHHELQRPVVPRAVGRGGAGRLSWTDYGDAGGDRRAPPLAKLTADVLV